MSEYDDTFLCCDACCRNVVRRYAHLSDIEPRSNGHTLCAGCWNLMRTMQHLVDVHNGSAVLEVNGVAGLTSADFIQGEWPWPTM